MQPSDELISLVLQNYKTEASSSGPLDVARRFYSRQDGVIIVGSEPNDWFEDNDSIARFFEASSADKLEIKVEVLKAYCEGTVGWTVDRVTVKLPNGGGLPVRHTRIFHKENDAWKVVHLHVSVAVPEESVGE